MIKIKFKVLMTGSDGNCCLLKYKDTTILIDAGFKTKSKMEEILEPVLLENKIDAILITHEHTDHLSQWTGRLSMDYKIPIYLHEKHSEGENLRKAKYFSYINRKINKEYFAELVYVTENQEFSIKDLKVYPFVVYHDARKTLGFRFNDDEFAYVSDCGFLSNNIKKELLKVNNLALELNYDKDKIMNSTRFWQNKERSINIFGHLSNQEAVSFLKLAKSRGKEYQNLITLHISNTNNEKDLIKREIDKLDLKNTNIYISDRENNPEVQLYEF